MAWAVTLTGATGELRGPQPQAASVSRAASASTRGGLTATAGSAEMADDGALMCTFLSGGVEAHLGAERGHGRSVKLDLQVRRTAA